MSSGWASTSGSVAGVPPGVVSSAYTLIVDTKVQCARGHAATARATHDGVRATSTTASNSSAARSAGISSVRSSATWRTPSGTEPDAPRAATLTSCPRAAASTATARDRKTVPPSTRNLMGPSLSFRRPTGLTKLPLVDRSSGQQAPVSPPGW